VERSDSDLWLSVLGDDNRYRRQLIDQVRGRPKGATCRQVFLADLGVRWWIRG
jgi:hypothetical protein